MRIPGSPENVKISNCDCAESIDIVVITTPDKRPMSVARVKCGIDSFRYKFERKFLYLIPLHNAGNILRFKDYVVFANGPSIRTTEVEKNVNLSEPINGDSDAEIDIKTPLKTVTFSNALHCFGNCESIPYAVFSSLHEVEKALFRFRNQKDCETSISQNF
ncbi:hypothetical protein TNCV_947021 [Trichonephila clavipes]|nr:hypothetical protein TNCV_947021 [Trichonephila clavipes]